MGINLNENLRGTETLQSLGAHAEKHRDWRDHLNWFFGNDITSDPSKEDWSARDIDADGRVKVTAFDAAIGRSQPELQMAYEMDRRNKLKASGAFIAAEEAGLIDRTQITPSTTLSSLTKLFNDHQTYKETAKPIIEKIGLLPKGSEALSQLGEKPSLTALRSTFQRLSQDHNRDPGNITSEHNITKEANRHNQWSRDRGDRSDRNQLLSTKFQQDLALHTAKTNDDWKRFELAMRQADREQTRRDNRQQLLWQMEQRNLDRAYNRERDERADSRAKAQQRLALILKMIGGIG